MSGFIVVRPSQHGEDDKVLETDFDTAEEAQAWIDRLLPDEAAYMPFVEAA